MSGESWRALKIDSVESIPVAGVNWRPLRRELGVEAFGVNAYTADAGEQVVEEHTEQGLQHEEIYVVLAGAAVFELDDERHDAPAGTVVHIPNTHVKRSAQATVDGTTVLAVGAPVGRPYTTSAWEWAFGAQKFRPTADHESALALLDDGLAHHPDNPSILYEIACWEAIAGRPDDALVALGRAVSGDPRCATWAQQDDDLATVRDLPGFPAPA
jgi:quercetin dioxygenase-like cupin family protein